MNFHQEKRATQYKSSRSFKKAQWPVFLLYLHFIGIITSARSLAATDLPIEGQNTSQQFHTEVVEKNSIKKSLSLSSFFEIPTHSFLISTDSGRLNQQQVGQRIQYNPTFGPNIGVSGTYDFWILTLSKRLSFANQQDTQTYGKSDYDDLRVGYNFSKEFLVESYYQNYRGFYTDLNGKEGLQTSFGSDNSQSSADSQSSSSHIISRPDISTLNYGLRATLALPLMPLFKIFSSEQEKKSMNWDFNFLTKAYYNHLSITGNQPLVPASTTNSFSPIASLKEYWTNTLGVGAGLGVVVPASSQFIFGFDSILGVGFQRQTNVFVDHESVAYTTAQEMNSNLYADWKSENHGFRFGLYLDTFSSKVDNINFDSSSLGLNLTYSYSGLKL